MERIVIFARTTKTEGEIRLRFRLTDGRRADLYHKSNIKASLTDLAKFNVDGSLRPKVSVYNKQLEEDITREIDAMRRAYRHLVEDGYRDGIFGKSRYKHYSGVRNRMGRYLKINGLEAMTPSEFDAWPLTFSSRREL